MTAAVTEEVQRGDHSITSMHRESKKKDAILFFTSSINTGWCSQIFTGKFISKLRGGWMRLAVSESLRVQSTYTAGQKRLYTLDHYQMLINTHLIISYGATKNVPWVMGDHSIMRGGAATVTWRSDEWAWSARQRNGITDLDERCSRCAFVDLDSDSLQYPILQIVLIPADCMRQNVAEYKVG